MSFFMKLSAMLLLITISISSAAYFLWYNPKFKATNTFTPKKTTATNYVLLQRLQKKALEVFNYANTHNYNTKHCFLIDMKVESGKNRFFVYNIKKDSIELQGLVTHGSGKTASESIQFSNEANSLCTSLGKYKVGISYHGKFGLAYKLHGLDATNNNAYNRAVVLHAHDCVPNAETTPFPICESWGCPTVSPDFLQALKKYIASTNKPMLLSVYY
jgi:hypothetical protein